MSDIQTIWQPQTPYLVCTRMINLIQRTDSRELLINKCIDNLFYCLIRPILQRFLQTYPMETSCHYRSLYKSVSANSFYSQCYQPLTVLPYPENWFCSVSTVVASSPASASSTLKLPHNHQKKVTQHTDSDMSPLNRAPSLPLLA